MEDNGYLHEFGSIHGGQKATKGHKCVALLDSGSPFSFVTQAAINEMLQKGAASADMIAVNDKPRKWGGFTESEEALQTNSTAGLSVQFYNSKEPTAYMQLYCHIFRVGNQCAECENNNNNIVTPTALQHDLLLGRDSFLKFQNHTYATLPNETGKPSVGILDLRKNPKVVALIQRIRCKPIASRSYRYNPVVAKEVDSIIDKYLKAGIIRRSQSPYAAPIVVVLKKNGKIRITCDYRRLNEATVIPQAPIPRIRKIATTAFHPKSNGGVERVNHSLAQMLSLVISEQQDDWDEWLPCGVQAYNNSVSAATGLAPNEIHLGRMPRLPMTVIDECVVKGHTGERQDQLLYLDIVRERQQRAFELVQESHLIAMSKIQRSNTKLLAILHKLPNFEVGNWVWTYNPQAIIGQGGGGDSSQIVTKLSLNWTGPYKILVVAPGLGPDGRPVADKTLELYLDLPTDMPGKDQKKRVSLDRCKMCHNPSDDLDIPKYLPAGLSKYVLHSFTDKSPHFTQQLRMW